jgi:hypothetical protein
MALTAKEQTEYAAKLAEHFGKCPRCDGGDLDASDYDGDRTMSCKVVCGGCGLEWTELYRFEQAVNFGEG